jgi:hypothetical protein
MPFSVDHSFNLDSTMEMTEFIDDERINLLEVSNHHQTTLDQTEIGVRDSEK